MILEQIKKENLFAKIDFANLSIDTSFKEDSVREEIILPIIKALGYEQENIVRSKSLKHPFVKIGSKERHINIFPDYLFKIGDNYAWVLDAKKPTEKIEDGGNVEQVFSYAIHPEVRSAYFAICNGVSFAVFRTDSSIPILSFQVNEIEKYWDRLKQLLSITSFHFGKEVSYYKPLIQKRNNYGEDNENWYKDRPLLEEIVVKKQAVKRHYGVHGYFTRQAWNVVREYIVNFTKPGDLVLDPFGGSGVTAIEAMMLDRKSINIDLNPMAVFLVDSLIAPIKEGELASAFERVRKEYIKKEAKTKKEVEESLKTYKYPKGFNLPKGSDVDTVDKLFSYKQLANLALLKYVIKKEKNINIKKTLMLMFSGMVAKINLTCHNVVDKDTGKILGGFDAAPFKYYRYRIALSHLI